MADRTKNQPKEHIDDKLGDEMKKMLAEREKMRDPNRKQDDSESDKDSSDDGDVKEGDIVFNAPLDVGSHFIDVTPDEELEFTDAEGTQVAQFQI